jgi:hypothetical protein
MDQCKFVKEPAVNAGRTGEFGIFITGLTFLKTSLKKKA